MPDHGSRNPIQLTPVPVNVSVARAFLSMLWTAEPPLCTTLRLEPHVPPVRLTSVSWMRVVVVALGGGMVPLGGVVLASLPDPLLEPLPELLPPLGGVVLPPPVLGGGVVPPLLGGGAAPPLSEDPPVRSTMNVSRRFLQPKAVSAPRVPSHVLENNAHLPSFDICA